MEIGLEKGSQRGFVSSGLREGKALRKNKQYWNLKLKVDKVAFETIPEILDSNIQLNPKWGYLTHLYHRVKEDASLKYWCEQIFGMMV